MRSFARSRAGGVRNDNIGVKVRVPGEGTTAILNTYMKFGEGVPRARRSIACEERACDRRDIVRCYKSFSIISALQNVPGLFNAAATSVSVLAKGTLSRDVPRCDGGSM